MEKTYNSVCWKCKHSVGGSYDAGGNTRCIECGWFICSRCGACSRGCRFNRRHLTDEYKNLVHETEEKKRREEETSRIRHEQWLEQERQQQVNSFAGNTVKYSLRLVTWAASIGAATVGTVVRAAPFLINSESETTHKIDDAIDKTTGAIEKTGFSIAAKAGKAIDKMLGKDDYWL